MNSLPFPEIHNKTIKNVKSPWYQEKAIVECTDGTAWSFYASGQPPTIMVQQVCAKCFYNQAAHEVGPSYVKRAKENKTPDWALPYKGLCRVYTPKIF